MGEDEKLARELDMLARDLQGMRNAHCIKLMRNKRLPLSERYAALMIYQGQFKPAHSSDESRLIAIKQSLIEIDRDSL